MSALFTWNNSYFFKTLKQTNSKKFKHAFEYRSLNLESSFVHENAYPKTFQNKSSPRLTKTTLQQSPLFDKFLPPSLSLLYFWSSFTANNSEGLLSSGLLLQVLLLRKRGIQSGLQFSRTTRDGKFDPY